MAITAPIDKTLIQIYACGGTGYNLAKQLQQEINQSDLLNDLVNIVYMDTSDANNHELNTHENTIVFGSGKGSGKIRGENTTAIQEGMAAALLKHKPGVFNIVLAGASGGSGSTVMNVLNGELMTRGQVAVNFTVGSMASAAEIKNTDKTFRTFANMVKVHKKPVLLNYRENSRTMTKETVDRIVINNCLLTCLLFAGRDDKMDIADLTHFLNYPTVTNFPASLVGFDIFAGEPTIENHEVLLTAATLGTTGSDTHLDHPTEYQTAGVLPDELSGFLKENKVMNWVTLGNSFGPIMKDLATRCKAFDEAAAAVKLESFASIDDIDGTAAIIL